jgi:hypothetical protein
MLQLRTRARRWSGPRGPSAKLSRSQPGFPELGGIPVDIADSRIAPGDPILRSPAFPAYGRSKPRFFAPSDSTTAPARPLSRPVALLHPSTQHFVREGVLEQTRMELAESGLTTSPADDLENARVEEPAAPAEPEPRLVAVRTARPESEVAVECLRRLLAERAGPDAARLPKTVTTSGSQSISSTLRLAHSPRRMPPRPARSAASCPARRGSS